MTLLRSYMMETDLPMCVLICLGVYLDLKKEKFVTNKQKIFLDRFGLVGFAGSNLNIYIYIYISLLIPKGAY